MNYKYKIGDIVLVYNYSSSFKPDGFVGKIVDRDKNSTDYLVSDFFTPNTESITDLKGRTHIVGTTRWISEDFMEKLNFDKPKSLLQKIKDLWRVK